MTDETIGEHLAAALEACEDDRAAYHLRQAMQLRIAAERMAEERAECLSVP